MKKTFALQAPDKPTTWVLERVRSEVGKYMNREKRKALPDGCERWEFDCRVGPDAATAASLEAKQVHEAIGAIAAAGAEQVYVEVHARAKPAAEKTSPRRVM